MFDYEYFYLQMGTIKAIAIASLSISLFVILYVNLSLAYADKMVPPGLIRIVPHVGRHG